MEDDYLTPDQVPLDSIVAMRCLHNPKWVMMARFNQKLAIKYSFAHSPPYTSQKGNIEPDYPEAVYKHIELKDQTPENLRRIYDESEKHTGHTKADEHKLFCIIRNP